MTQIADLWVSLGIRGSEKTVSSLSNVNKGLGEIASTSLAVKAAVLGAIYGLERLLSHSANQGLSLSNFATITGESTKQLQQWQYAAQQAGASAEEFNASFKGIREHLTDIKFNEGIQKYAGVLSQAVGFDINKAKDAKTGEYYVLGQLQKLAHTGMEKAVIERIAKAFGVNSENMLAGLFKGVYNEKNFSKAPFYDDKEIKKLSEAKIAMLNLSQSIDMAFGRFFSKYAPQFIAGMQPIIASVVRLSEAFVKIGDQLGIFKYITEAFKGWEIILTNVVKLIEKINPGTPEQKKKDEKVIDKYNDSLDKLSVGDQLQLFLKGLLGIKEDPEFFKQREIQPFQKSITPKLPTAPPVNQEKTQNNGDVNVYQTFNHDGKDHQQLKESTSQGVVHAYKQLWAQGRVT